MNNAETLRASHDATRFQCAIDLAIKAEYDNWVTAIDDATAEAVLNGLQYIRLAHPLSHRDAQVNNSAANEMMRKAALTDAGFNVQLAKFHDNVDGQLLEVVLDWVSTDTEAVLAATVERLVRLKTMVEEAETERDRLVERIKDEAASSGEEAAEVPYAAGLTLVTDD